MLQFTNIHDMSVARQIPSLKPLLSEIVRNLILIFYILQVSLKLTHILWDRFICKTLVLQQSDSKIKHLIILVYDNYLLTLLCPLILIYQLQINLCTWCKYIVYDYRLKI